MLRAISHDLRTPLTSIFGSSAALLSDSSEQLSDNGQKLLEDIRDDSEWLIRMIENLLTVTKLSDGSAALKETEEAVEELVAEATLDKETLPFPFCGSACSR
ncbi:MAG: histidine kinase dimerization/phospho-acceptor domain-containing protein [Lachnospiraceae bacterium]